MTQSDSKKSNHMFSWQFRRLPFLLKHMLRFKIDSPRRVALYITARNWCTILLTAFDACYRPFAMQVQQSPTNATRCYVSRLINEIDGHNLCSILCARAQAFADQVCQGSSSAAGHRATFGKVTKNQESLNRSRVVYTTRFVGYLPMNGRLPQAYKHQPKPESLMPHHTVIIAEVRTITSFHC